MTYTGSLSPTGTAVPIGTNRQERIDMSMHQLFASLEAFVSQARPLRIACGLCCVVLLCSAGAQGKPAADDSEGTAAAISLNATPAEREHEAWSLLSDAAGDLKRPQSRIQALAALGLMRSARSEKMITDAMHSPDVDVRTAAALAAGETEDRNMTSQLRTMLDDAEPQVAFAAATTLWKMGDHSGEDILVAIVDGERKAGPTLMHGTEHEISRNLHDPTALAKLGAMQGASMLLGPFGYGITAYEYIHKSGGDLARVAAIEDIAQQRTAPIHAELLAALKDKDPAVRAAAAKAVATYHDTATALAIYDLFADARQPVRLTSAAAYLIASGSASAALRTPPPAH